MKNKELKCPICGGEIVDEVEIDCGYKVCKDCDCIYTILEDKLYQPYSDVTLYIANYGTDENIEIFNNFKEAKEYSIDSKVHKALFNGSNLWYEEIGWNYYDKYDLFLETPYEVFK